MPVLAAGPTCAPGAWAEQAPLRTLAVLPVEIDDNSGETGGPGRHDAMLATITRAVSEQIAAERLYRVVPADRVAAAIAAANPGTWLRACNGCERDIAQSVGADQVLIGWIFKMSSLVLSLHVVIKDVDSGNVVYARTFDFRGDNEKAWQRAANYMVETVRKRIKPDVQPTTQRE